VALQRILEDVVRLLAHFMGNVSRQDVEGRGSSSMLLQVRSKIKMQFERSVLSKFFSFLFPSPSWRENN